MVVSTPGIKIEHVVTFSHQTNRRHFHLQNDLSIVMTGNMKTAITTYMYTERMGESHCIKWH